MQNYINQANSQNINTNLIKINLSEPTQYPQYKTLPVKTVYDHREGKESTHSILNLSTELNNVFLNLTLFSPMQLLIQKKIQVIQSHS